MTADRVGLDDFNSVPDMTIVGNVGLEVEDDPPPAAPWRSARIVTLEEFVAVDEPGAAPIVGDDDQILIPENGDVMFYGDGGAGKTTLTVDLACHLAAGDDWLGIRIAAAIRVLIVENEGPRPLFRAKLKRKLEAWAGSSIEGRVLLWQEPWAGFTFGQEDWRQALADTLAEFEVDVVMIGPVTAAGMLEAGTLQDVRSFAALVSDVRGRTGRHVTFVLVHHENKGGQVSGAWEGVGDTLFHVQAQGHGRTRLYVQKARWASEYHATTLHLLWGDGEAFTVADKPELDDDTIAEQITAFVAEHPGTGWTAVEKATPGVAKQKRREIRAGLFAAGALVNRVGDVFLDNCPERQKAALFLADDPTLNGLRPPSGADGAQPEPLWGARGELPLRPAPVVNTGAGEGAADGHPPDELAEIARLESLAEGMGL